MIKIRGTSGYLEDLEPEDLPLNAITGGDNFTIKDGYPASAKGYEAVWGTPSIAPYWCIQQVDVGATYWIYTNLTSAYRVNAAGTHADITRYTTTPGDDNYTGGATDLWNGCVLGTIPIINNGVDVPQQWDGATSRFKDLSNWTSTSVCKSIRTFKNYLIALNVTKNGTQYPQMIKWSHGSDPLAVPSSWDETDATKDAGETNLIASTGEVIDGGQLRDVFIIYKEDSTYIMQYIGGQFVFSIRPLFKTSGILSVNCWQEYKGIHYVLTRGDVIAHDGSSIIPIATRRVRNYLFDDLDPDNYIRAFVALNPKEEEVWFCYPSVGSTYCNRGLVYHVTDKKWSIRGLPNVGYINNGIVEATTATTWASIGLTWSTANRVWNYSPYNPSSVSMLFCSTADTKLHKGDYTNQADGTNIPVTIERTGNAHIAQDIIDDSVYKYIGSVWPRISAPAGTQVNVSVGVQDRIESAILWSNPVVFTVGVDDNVDFDLSGKYWGTRFSTTSDSNWKLQGYDVDVKPQGRF